MKSWQHAKSRCFNPKDAKYPQYGGRGISMCDRWKDSFSNFIEDMGPAPEGHTIDRINVNGNYDPSNCAWANAHTQARHRTDNVIIEYTGRQWILKDLAAHLNVNYKALHGYLRGKKPISLEEALKRLE